jgi:hypothetical protein
LQPLNYVQVSAAAVKQVIEKIEGVVVGVPEDQVKLACLVIAVSISCDDFTLDELLSGVRGADEWIALYATSLHEKLSKSEVN